MSNFNLESISKQIKLNNNLVWCNDLKNDNRHNFGWIKENLQEISNRLSNISWKKYGNNMSEIDYQSNFILDSITFFKNGGFELTYNQIGVDIPKVRARYSNRHRLNIIELEEKI